MIAAPDLRLVSPGRSDRICRNDRLFPCMACTMQKEHAALNDEAPMWSWALPSKWHCDKPRPEQQQNRGGAEKRNGAALSQLRLIYLASPGGFEPPLSP